jgi:hypothetical protein
MSAVAYPGLGRILDALEARGKVRSAGDQMWDCRCPCPGHKHDDANPSGRVVVMGNRVVPICYAKALGHTWKEWVYALGLAKADWFLSGDERSDWHQPRMIFAKYPYHDEDGKVLYTVVRTEPKGFWQERPFVTDDKRELVLHGMQAGWYALDRDRWKPVRGTEQPAGAVLAPECRRVIYRLPEVEAAPLEEPVFFVEGEKVAELLRHFDLVATTTSQGASHFTPGQLKPLKDRHVVVVPDADPDGFRHACTVAGACMMVLAASVRVVRWKKAEVPPGGDLTDWVRATGIDDVYDRAVERFYRQCEPYALADTTTDGHVLREPSRV